MKKETWYLKNYLTIVRVDKIKEFSDIFTNYSDVLTEQIKKNMLEYQQAQLSGSKFKVNPLEVVIKDEEFEVLWSKINQKLKSKGKIYEYLVFSKNPSPRDNRLIIVSQSFDNMRNQKNKETVIEQIEDCAKID